MRTARNIFLYPVSLIYGLITAVRNFLYNYNILSATVFPIPVICVGNLTVGGTGKTPHTEYVVDLLRKNFKVAVLSRGFKRETRDFRVVSFSSTVSEIGDEPLQIFRKFPDILVAVDRKRVNGAWRIMHFASDTEVIILDDGFQHRSMTPGLSIVLSDFERPFMRDYMLPYGNLREDKSNMSRADIILITKCPKNLNPIQRRLIVKEIGKAPYQNLYFTSISYRSPLPVFGDQEKDLPYFDLTKCAGSSVVLLTGIADPKPLREYLDKFFNEIIDLTYPDHYSYKASDIASINAVYNDLRATSKYIMTTEKDAVKLREFTDIEEVVKSAIFYVPVGITFLNDNKDEFDSLIVDYVRKNKENIRISQR